MNQIDRRACSRPARSPPHAPSPAIPDRVERVPARADDEPGHDPAATGVWTARLHAAEW